MNLRSGANRMRNNAGFTINSRRLTGFRKEKRMTQSKIVAVDFDGTLCKNNWPDIGEENANLIRILRFVRKNGVKLILWTCRTGAQLDSAIEWCKERRLEFDAINANLPEVINSFGGDTRKIVADYYIDDKAISSDCFLYPNADPFYKICEDDANCFLYTNIDPHIKTCTDDEKSDE